MYKTKQYSYLIVRFRGKGNHIYTNDKHLTVKILFFFHLQPSFCLLSTDENRGFPICRLNERLINHLSRAFFLLFSLSFKAFCISGCPILNLANVSLDT